MVIYRPHRGGLSESMKDHKIFDDFAMMRSYIASEMNSVCGSEILSPEDVVISTEYFKDSRIGWNDCRHVCIKRLGNEVFKYPACIGFCATDFERKGIKL